MSLEIRPLRDCDIRDLVELSLLAWEPVFASFEQVLGKTVYRLIWPDWHNSQSEAVEAICKNEKMSVLVVELNQKVVGFIAFELNHQNLSGEVHLLAVHPEYQNQGIGVKLNESVLIQMQNSGMKLAKVETGGDPAHAPARACYEKAGYTALPLVRYFKAL